MKDLELDNGLFEVIYESELLELTRSLNPLLLLVELYKIDAYNLARFINGLDSAEKMLGEKRHSFTAEVHRSNIQQNVKTATKANLRMASIPVVFGMSDSRQERIWLLLFNNKEDQQAYLEKISTEKEKNE